MRYKVWCPHSDCPSRTESWMKTTRRKTVHSNGYRVSKDGHRVRRYFCRCCGRYFSYTSLAINGADYGYETRSILRDVFLLITGGFTGRRAAADIGISKPRLANMRRHLAEAAYASHLKALDVKRKIAESRGEPVLIVELDEQEDYVHSKYLPVSIVTAAERDGGFVIGFAVGRFNSSVHATEAERRYGRITPTREAAFTEVASQIQRLAGDRQIVLCTDQKPEYKTWARMHLPGAIHYAVRSSGNPKTSPTRKQANSNSCMILLAALLNGWPPVRFCSPLLRFKKGRCA